MKYKLLGLYIILILLIMIFNEFYYKNKYLCRKYVRDIADYDIDNNYDLLLKDIDNNNIKDKSIIAVLPKSLNLIYELLPKINNKIILLFVDHNTNSQCNSYNNYKDILNNNKIYHIFSENWYDKPHKKLTQTPIGISYNDTYLNNLYTKLENISIKMKENKDKPLRVLCNAHKKTYKNPKSGYRDDRVIMMKYLENSDIVDFCDEKHDFSKQQIINTWIKHNDYAFELSPSGNGLDCHRTYESIILKTIPIVRTNTLDPVFKKHDLPVVIVKEWDEVTKDNLKKWHDKYKGYFNDELEQKMKINYWKNIILSKKI